MYLPRHFEQSESAVMHAFIAAHPFATLVRSGAAGLSADHIPMLLESEADGDFVLRGHVARANPLWKELAEGSEVLAIFQDQGGYITPSWYASKAEHGKVVPTWNYVAVHAEGRARAVADPAWLRAFLERLTRVHEAGRQPPWHVSDAPEDFIALQLKAIVGIEVRVTRLVGKWKASQNRPARDQEQVIAALRERADPASMRMADQIEATRRRR